MYVCVHICDVYSVISPTTYPLEHEAVSGLQDTHFGCCTRECEEGERQVKTFYLCL